jgi:hypothetical protein
MRRSRKVTLDLDPEGDPIGGWLRGRNVPRRRFDGYVQLIGALEGLTSRSRQTSQTREGTMSKSIRGWWVGGAAACIAVAALAVIALSGGGLAHGRTAPIQKTGAPLTPEEWQQLTANTTTTTPAVQVTPTGNVTCAAASKSKVQLTLYQFRVGSGATDSNLGDPSGRWDMVTNTESSDVYTGPVTLPAPSGSGTGYDQVQTTTTDCSGQSVTESTPPLEVGNGPVSGASVPSAPQNPNLSVYPVKGQADPTWTVSWNPPASMASCNGEPPSDYIATVESSPDGSSNWIPVYEFNYAHSGEQGQLMPYMAGHQNMYFRVLVSLVTPCGQAGAAATSNVVNAGPDF